MIRRARFGFGRHPVYAMNRNTVLDVNSAFGTTGSSWLVPTQIALARMVKLGAQIDF
jgi:hypothetical protein